MTETVHTPEPEYGEHAFEIGDRVVRTTPPVDAGEVVSIRTDEDGVTEYRVHRVSLLGGHFTGTARALALDPRFDSTGRRRA